MRPGPGQPQNQLTRRLSHHRTSSTQVWYSTKLIPVHPTKPMPRNTFRNVHFVPNEHLLESQHQFSLLGGELTTAAPESAAPAPNIIRVLRAGHPASLTTNKRRGNDASLCYLCATHLSLRCESAVYISHASSDSRPGSLQRTQGSRSRVGDSVDACGSYLPNS